MYLIFFKFFILLTYVNWIKKNLQLHSVSCSPFHFLLYKLYTSYIGVSGKTASATLILQSPFLLLYLLLHYIKLYYYVKWKLKINSFIYSCIQSRVPCGIVPVSCGMFRTRGTLFLISALWWSCRTWSVWLYTLLKRARKKVSKPGKIIIGHSHGDVIAMAKQ